MENKLIAKLAQAGASDIEAAVLLAKTQDKGCNDIDGAVAQLKKEKPHLFETTARAMAGQHQKRPAQKIRRHRPQALLNERPERHRKMPTAGQVCRSI